MVQKMIKIKKFKKISKNEKKTYFKLRKYIEKNFEYVGKEF